MLDKPLLCRNAAAEGTVLLKNEDRLLPLKKGVKLAVFGDVLANSFSRLDKKLCRVCEEGGSYKVV